jgi:hypothetical protein
MTNAPKFSLGSLVATPAAFIAIADAGQTAWDFLSRHVRGDYGDVDSHDRKANEDAIKEGTRVFSAYTTAKGIRLWCITEADRSSTCLLLPSEY